MAQETRNTSFNSSSRKQDSQAAEVGQEASPLSREQQELDEEKHISGNRATNLAPTDSDRNVRPRFIPGARTLIAAWAAILIMNLSYIYTINDLSRPLQILSHFVCVFPLSQLLGSLANHKIHN